MDRRMVYRKLKLRIFGNTLESVRIFIFFWLIFNLHCIIGVIIIYSANSKKNVNVKEMDKTSNVLTRK